MKCNHCGEGVGRAKPPLPKQLKRKIIGPQVFETKYMSDIAKEIKAGIKSFNHYSVIADMVMNYYKSTGLSERSIARNLALSKSEVHRLLLLGSLPKGMLEASLEHNIEKYVLLEWQQLPEGLQKFRLKALILKGHMRKRRQFKKSTLKESA